MATKTPIARRLVLYSVGIGLGFGVAWVLPGRLVDCRAPQARACQSSDDCSLARLDRCEVASVQRTNEKMCHQFARSTVEMVVGPAQCSTPRRVELHAECAEGLCVAVLNEPATKVAGPTVPKVAAPTVP